jgi:rhodanese-related sulfurtransferase
MKKVLLILFTLLITTSVFAEDKVIGIDVRSYIERKVNPAPGSLSISNSEIKDEIVKQVPDKSAKIKVFCEVGGRAAYTKKVLDEMGYKNVENIKNWRNWSKLNKK